VAGVGTTAGNLLTFHLQDDHPTLWFSEDGKRIGNFLGHKGAVVTCDISSKDALVPCNPTNESLFKLEQV
jgi:hypothetical protein